MKIKVRPWSWYFWAALSVLEGIQTYLAHRYGSLGRAELFGATFLFCIGCGFYSFLHRKPKPPAV